MTSQKGFRGPNYPRHPTGGPGMGCDMALWRGCSCDTPATHSKLRKEPRQGCSYTLERDMGGGVASAPLSVKDAIVIHILGQGLGSQNGFAKSHSHPVSGWKYKMVWDTRGL